MIVTAEEMLAYLPQKYPFILVDKIEILNEGELVIGQKAITHSEFWTAGHFEQKPIFPGVLLIETTAQTAGFLFYDTTRRGLGYLIKVIDFKFMNFAIPGDVLRIEATKIYEMNGHARVKVIVTKDDKKVATGVLEMMFKEDEK